MRSRYVFTLLVALFGLLCSRSPAAATKPNIILIFCDDLGYGDLGRYGLRLTACVPHPFRRASWQLGDRQIPVPRLAGQATVDLYRDDAAQRDILVRLGVIQQAGSRPPHLAGGVEAGRRPVSTDAVDVTRRSITAPNDMLSPFRTWRSGDAIG